eukprot:888349-Prorocentrum_minimum.AAC.5
MVAFTVGSRTRSTLCSAGMFAGLLTVVTAPLFSCTSYGTVGGVTCQSASQSVSQSVSKPVGQSVSQPVDQSVVKCVLSEWVS